MLVLNTMVQNGVLMGGAMNRKTVKMVSKYRPLQDKGLVGVGLVSDMKKMVLKESNPIKRKTINFLY